jgi:hypothetical protein
VSALDRVPASVLSEQLAYVAGARGPLARLWRSAVAAWRCARRAARPDDVIERERLGALKDDHDDEVVTRRRPARRPARPRPP